MTIAAPIVVGSPTFGESNGAVATTLSIPKPTVGVVIQNGDLLIAAIRNGTSSQATDYTLTGWSRRAVTPMPTVSAANRLTGLYAHYVTDATAEPASYVFTLAGNAFARQSGMIFVTRPAPGAAPWGADPTLYQSLGFNAGPPPYPTSFAVAPGSLLIWAAGNELTSPNALTWTPPPGSTAIGIHGSMTSQADTTVTRSTIAVAWEVASGTTAGGVGEPIVFPSYSTPVPVALAIPGTLAPIPAHDGAGATVYLTEWNGTAERDLVSVDVWYPGYASVTNLLAAVNTPTVAHRGGSLNWPEMSEWAYDHSVMRGYGVLEFSCGWSSDLVPFGLGYQYIDAVDPAAPLNTDPMTLSWATISATYQNKVRPVWPGIYQPFYRLVDFLTKYTPQRVVAVDPKYAIGDATKINAMLDICDAHGGPSRIILKFDTPLTDLTMTNAGHARGYKCMNYWGASVNSAAMAAQQVNWDIIGAAYDDAAMLTQAKTYGKPTWAAVIPSQAGYATAKAAGVTFAMISDVASVTPVSHWT